MKKRILFFSENIRNKPLVKIFGLRNKSEYEPKNRKQKLCNNEEKLRNTTSNDFLMFLITHTECMCIADSIFVLTISQISIFAGNFILYLKTAEKW